MESLLPGSLTRQFNLYTVDLPLILAAKPFADYPF